MRFSSSHSVRDKISVVLGGLDICSSGASAGLGSLEISRIIPIPVLEIVLKIVVRFGNKQIVTENNQGLTI